MTKYVLPLMLMCAACATTNPGPMPTAPVTPPVVEEPAPAPVPTPEPPAAVAPAPATPAPVVPPRVGLTLPVPKGGDRASVLLGAVLVLGNRGLKIKMDACGGKEWAWESWGALPLQDLGCDCTVENYRAEGCYAVKWVEVETPQRLAPGGYRSDQPLKFDPTATTTSPPEAPLPRKEAKP